MKVLRRLREELHLTLEDAAKICGVSRDTYEYYEDHEYVDEKYEKIFDMLKASDKKILNVRQIKKVTKPIFMKHSAVSAAYLFGSYSRGEATTESDVDLVIVLKEAMGLEFAGLACELEDVLGKDVDLVTPYQLTDNEEFLKRVLNDAIKIYKKEK